MYVCSAVDAALQINHFGFNLGFLRIPSLLKLFVDPVYEASGHTVNLDCDPSIKSRD